MLFIYRFLTFFLFPLFALLIFLRKIIKKEDSNRFKEKIFSSFFSSNRNYNKKLYWFHAASIGEVLSIMPLIDALNEKNTNLDFLITTVTLSSSNLINEKLLEYKNITHRFFPLDSNHLVKKFLDQWMPDIVCFVDSEIWPNFLIEIKKRNIPLALVNARITKKTYMRWKKFSSFSKLIFSKFDLCLASSLDSKNNLENLKAKNIKNFGNLKFCVNNVYKNLDHTNKKVLDNYKVWCAANTHEGEEIICLKTHIEVKKEFTNLLTIIIPRHINRVKNIKKICENLKLKSQILKDGSQIDSNIDVLIINSFGVLQKYYDYCDNVFIGKSMIKKLELVGGQNPIEAAKSSCRIYHGPFIYNFLEIYNLLESYNITEQVENANELKKSLIKNLKNKKIIDKIQIEQLNTYGNKILKNTVNELNYIIKK